MEKFGSYNGEDIYEYRISNGSLEAVILNYGCVIKNLFFTKENGERIDLVLGYNTFDEYMNNDGYFGSLLGRVGNRIDFGKFSIDEKEYQLTINDGTNSLHGGINGFDKIVFKVNEYDESKIVLEGFSPDGDQGYPGNLNLRVIYEINSNSGFMITYEAICDRDTIINITNHTYFNLNGEASGTCLNQYVRINSDKITPINERLCPYNEFMNVENTIYDFRNPKQLITDFDLEERMMEICGGFDVNYAVNGDGFRNVCTVFSTQSNIQMDVFTDLPGLQLYSGNFITLRTGKKGNYDKWHGLCLETQNYPNAINCKAFPCSILRAGKLYKTKTEYRFSNLQK